MLYIMSEMQNRSYTTQEGENRPYTTPVTPN